MVEQESNLVLIIDDDRAVTDLLGLLLETRTTGLRIMTANSGTEGIRIARISKPDIILCDLMMPPPDGFEICKILTADQETRNIPIIIVTALSDEKIRDVCLANGAVEYLLKPVPARVLVDCIQKVLRRKRLGIYE